MSKLFQKLGRTRTPTATAGAAPRLTLAAFGKHPGWDDHMPGLGVDSETLAYLKQTLYVTGIGRQIDSGAWEKLEADKRQEGFDHTFLWLRAGQVVLGLLWSSKDGKGRSMYPMVLCVDGEGVSPVLLLNRVRPGLEALREACKAATSAEQVTSNWRVAQEQLRMLFAGSAPPPDSEPPGESPRRFLEHADLGPNRLGLLRVLHELSGNFGLAGDTRAGARGAAAPSLHLRVPLAADSQNSALLLWAEFLHCAISADISLVLMARGQADWLDVVVGEPKADDFFFLQASQKGFPLVTQIPYQLAPNALTRLREVEYRFTGEEPTTLQVAAKAATPAPPPLTKAPPPIPSPATAVPPPAAPSTIKLARSAPPAMAKAPAPAPPPIANAPPPAPPPAPKAPAPAPPPLASRAESPAPPSKRNGALAAGGVVVLLIVAFLVWMPHNKTGEQPRFDQLLASGKALLVEKKYDEAILDLEEADKVQPQNNQVKQLLDQARQQRDGAALAGTYQSAMKEGRGALASGDNDSALAQAEKALLLKPDDADAKQLRDEATNKQSGARPQLFTNSIKMEFVWVPALGAGGAYLGKYEVTRRQYQTIMGQLPEGTGPADGNVPVVGVSFPQAAKFCDELSKREKKHYSLPTRQQWLAAAGLSEDKVTNAWNILSAGGALEHEATSLQNPRRTKPVAVGTMGVASNGLCDMLGNVREWVSEQQRAGFSFQSRKGGRTEELFLPGSETDSWIEQETGLRCLLQESPPP